LLDAFSGVELSLPGLIMAAFVVILVSRATFEAAKYGRVSQSVLFATIAGVLGAIAAVCLAG